MTMIEVLKRGTKVSTAQVGFPQHAQAGTVMGYERDVTSLPGDRWYRVSHGAGRGMIYHESWITVTDQRPKRWKKIEG